MQTVKYSKAEQKQFFSILRTRVNQYFKDNNIQKTANFQVYLKTTLMLGLYLVPLVLMYAGVISGIWAILGYVIMGLGTAGIGLCVMHDANHGSYSSNKSINNLMSLAMNLIGGSSFTWKIQHNILHHSFTNIYHLDEDIDDKPFLRLSPFGKKKSYHKFQHIYALFIYGLATGSWILYKDFKQLRLYNSTGLTKEHGFNPVKESIILIGTKIAYVTIVLFLPMFFVANWYIILIGFVLLHLVAGFWITTVFQLAHVVEGPEHHELIEEDDQMENTWAKHQLSTTANFATKNKFLTYIVGGLNFQIEHHLFPNVSHIHYPKISKIVKKTAEEFDLSYHEFKTMGSALASHLRMLKQIGTAA